MKCPVCQKEMSRPLHITKSKDDAHKNFVIEQKELAKHLLLNEEKPLVDIQNDERIVLVETITHYLKTEFKEIELAIGRKNRNERISKAKYVDGGLRKKRKDELDSLVLNGNLGSDYVKCKICGLVGKHLTSHLSRVHNMSSKEYKKEYPDSETFCLTLRNQNKERMLENNPNDNPESIKRMKETKAKTKNYRIAKAKAQFASGERVAAKNVGRGLVGHRSDLGHSVRSMWEANMARILQLKGIEYEFEKEAFPFYDQNGNLIDSYLPDFYLPEYNAWLEVKGQMDEISQKKILLFLNEGYRLIIVDGKIYDKLSRKFKHKLNGKWEYSGHNIKTHPELFNITSEEN